MLENGAIVSQSVAGSYLLYDTGRLVMQCFCIDPETLHFFLYRKKCLQMVMIRQTEHL